MNKIITFARYLKDFLKYNEFIFVFMAIKYELFKKTTRHNRLYKSSLGLFISRKNTLDFQFANYAYEWNVKKCILKNYKDYDVFIDIGSHIGTYSILLANKGLRCYAFEPVGDNFRALSINVYLNKLDDKVQVFNYGLGSDDKLVDFIFEKINTGASHISHNEKDKRHETVKLKTFDSIFPSLKIRPEEKVLMKIDVEGMELEVINGAKKFLSEHQNIFIVMESIYSEEEKLKKALLQIAEFEFYKVDHFNMATKKIIK